jgi:hypothetical protein
MSSPPERSRNASASTTVIIPTFNRADYLASSITAILNQTVPADQIIVVDDGSRDHTEKVVKAFEPRVQYLRKENGGKSTALNLGLQYATGDLIWIFDDDDIAEPDALERLSTALRDNPDCGFAYGRYDHFTVDQKGAASYRPVHFPDVPPSELFLALMEWSFILQQGLLVRRSCYEEVGPFDEDLIRSQDLEMMLRLARRYKGVRVDGILFHLRQHSGIRGSSGSPVQASKKVEAWVASDRKIIGQIYRNQKIEEYQPLEACADPFTPEREFECLLRRAAILARKGMWEESAQDLRQARKVAESAQIARLAESQVQILRRIFDLFSYAPYTFDGAGDFLKALGEIQPRALRSDMRAAVLWPLPFTIGGAFLNRQYANVPRFIRVYLSLATPSAVARTLMSRSFLQAGLSLVRSKRNPERPQNQGEPCIAKSGS